MVQFNGSAKILAGTFKTFQELIHAAIDARTYSADGPTNLKLRAAAKQIFTAAAAGELFINPTNTIYTMDAYKGVRNGVTDQTAWAAGDFTAEPGGGEVLVAGKRHGHRTELGARVLYAAVDTVVYLDASFF